MVAPTSPRNDHVRNAPASASKLSFFVIATTIEGTRAAMAAAVEFARELDARITILAPQVVPYPLPLEEPPVAAAFTGRSLGAIAAEHEAEAAIEIHLCRDRREAIRQVLKRDSVVVIGARRRWWRPAPERRLAAALRREGYEVLLVDCGRRPAGAPARQAEAHSAAPSNMRTQAAK